jgi:hypothetical protein
MSTARAQLLASLVLASLVGVALVLRAAHLSRAVTLVALAALALANAAGVIAVHMNLRGESRALKLIFLLPMALAVLLAVSVVADAWHPGLRP